MNRRPTGIAAARLPLAAGLLASLLLHVTALLPAFTELLRSRGPGPGGLQASFEPEEVAVPDPPEVQLGLETSDASTLTWIGYEEYEAHMAALAETEQAAFQMEPTGAAAPAAQDPPPPPAAEQETAAADPLDVLAGWLEAARSGPGPPPGATPGAPALAEVLDRLERMLPEPQTDGAAAEAQAEADAPDDAAPGVPAPASDREADPTSTVEVPLEDLRIGRPLAAHGLQIKTRKPQFTPLILVTAAPANPLAELRFRRDGKPETVRLVQRCGDARVDEAILNSLYAWRASGEPLEKLKGDETLEVRIRIVLIE